MTAALRVGMDLSHVAVSPLTGVGVYARSLVAALARNHSDIDCRVAAMGARPVRENLEPLAQAGARVRCIPVPTRLRLAAWMRFQFPPLEWLTGPIDIAFGGFHLAPPARRAARVALVYDVSWRHFPGINTPETNAMNERVMRHSARHADAFIAISESTRDDLVSFYGIDPERVHVVLGGIDWPEFDIPFDAAAHAGITARLGIDGPYFIYLGSLEPRKNLPRLIEAYARLRSARPDVPKLVLVGAPAWMCEPVFTAIEQHGLTEHIVSTGYLPRAETMCLLRGAAACAFVSLYEGFGLPVLEAMASGTPVVTANVSSLPEVAGDTALLVDPHDAEAIEAGLAAVLDDPEATRERADRALARAKTMTWDASADALARAFRAIHESRA